MSVEKGSVAAPSSAPSRRWSWSALAVILVVTALFSTAAFVQNARPHYEAKVPVKLVKRDVDNSSVHILKIAKPMFEANSADGVGKNDGETRNATASANIGGSADGTMFSKATKEALRQSMDFIDNKVDPCDDFFAFACGNSLKGKETSEFSTFHELRKTMEEALRYAFDKIRTKTKRRPPAVEDMYKFYDDCEAIKRVQRTQHVRVDFMSEVAGAIEAMGGIPLTLGAKWNEISIQTIIDKLLEWNYLPFFEFEQLAPPTRYRFSYRVKKGSNAGIRLESFRRALTEYGELTNTVFNDQSEQELLRVFEFSDRLFKIGSDGDGSSVFTFTTTIEKLKVYPQLNFTNIIRWSYPSKQYSSIGENDGININSDQESWAKYLNFLQSTDNRILVNYALINFYMDMKNKTNAPKPFLEYSNCFSAVLDNYVVPLSYIYNRQFQPSIQSAKHLIDNIIAAFRYNLENYEWLDEVTREMSIEKLENMKYLIGDPNIVEEMDELYSMIPSTEGMGYYQRMILMQKIIEKMQTYESNNTLFRLIANVEINAIYIITKNVFQINDGIMLPPVFNSDFAPLLNYARLGQAVGHEILHGYDSVGRHYDKNGKDKYWWRNKETNAKYDEGTKCFKQQYESEFADSTWLRENGKHTLSENIADNGGFNQAYTAYMKYEMKNDKLYQAGFGGFSGKQLFLIANAQTMCGNEFKTTRRRLNSDPHALVKFRVNFNMKNHNEFAEAFKCEIGTKMNPPKRKECHIW